MRRVLTHIQKRFLWICNKCLQEISRVPRRSGYRRKCVLLIANRYIRLAGEKGGINLQKREGE